MTWALGGKKGSLGIRLHREVSRFMARRRESLVNLDIKAMKVAYFIEDLCQFDVAKSDPQAGKALEGDDGLNDLMYLTLQVRKIHPISFWISRVCFKLRAAEHFHKAWDTLQKRILGYTMRSTHDYAVHFFVEASEKLDRHIRLLRVTDPSLLRRPVGLSAEEWLSQLEGLSASLYYAPLSPDAVRRAVVNQLMDVWSYLTIYERS